VEAFPIEYEGRQMVLVQDPAGLAEGPIILSPAGLFILGLFDGGHTLLQAQAAVQERLGQTLSLERLEEMVAQLDAAHYLDSEHFERFYQNLVDEFRRTPIRPCRDADSFGAGEEGLGPMIDRMLGGCSVGPAAGRDNGRLVGLVAPHLDYPRGGPCYLAAYRSLAENGPVERVVILGTNHFGRSSGPVATGKDFETPLGITRTDRSFLGELERACGSGLFAHEFDHLREHSIELQVVILQHLLGPGAFEIVPVLCSDPCGPTATAPHDGKGVDLRVFAEALGGLLARQDRRTLLIAGADLSHFGQRFGDSCDLDPPFLAEVERKDRDVLGAVVSGRPELLLEVVRSRDNDTRICSVGSIYALMAALPDARPELLAYHQTVDAESGIAVSCSAIAVWQKD